MPDTVETVVDAPAPEASTPPKKEHWKVREKRLREEALARGEAPEATPTENGAPAATGEVCGSFLTWAQFCNQVAVSIATQPSSQTILGRMTDSPEDLERGSRSFHATLRKAYLATKMAYDMGPEAAAPRWKK